MEQGAEEEINRLKETLTATSHEMQQIKEDFADHADKLQYAEKLLEKAKTDFRDRNSRIKALEAHLAESRNEISRLTRTLDYFKEESEFSKRNSSTLMNYAMSRQGQDAHQPHPCQAGPGHLFLD